ncbi:MAG: hypothetical protein K9N52_09480 [Verrucomicrobia bacterium]|nr:hypothetical protein [Verrucomicrobiota bacterium]
MQYNKKMSKSEFFNHPQLNLAFDVGHSSIGWAVFNDNPSNSMQNDNELPFPEILGCGTVIFGSDSCLASSRRQYRRQRRNIRATRHRIDRMRKLLLHLGVLTKEELESDGCAWPWLLAARVLSGGNLLTWKELWDVLRWYAHNRGYDSNRSWSNQPGNDEDDVDDYAKLDKARELFRKYGVRTMAETICHVMEIDPLGENKASQIRYKNLEAAFPREDVVAEVKQILVRHQGVLPKVDQKLISALFDDWSAISCPNLNLPLRYHGGLLFGQLHPRFHNRIISTCPIKFEEVYQAALDETGDHNKATHLAKKQSKVPLKECAEFYRFRWAMQLANVKIVLPNSSKPRTLTVDERHNINSIMEENGFLTKKEFRDAVRKTTNPVSDNLEQMMMHPDANKALVLNPTKKLVSEEKRCLSRIWPLLPLSCRKRAEGRLRRGKTITIRELLESIPDNEKSNLESEIQRYIDSENTKKRKKAKHIEYDDALDEAYHIERLSGRAPYHRDIMKKAYDEIMNNGIHPNEEGGCLYRTESIRQEQIDRNIDEQTNNHLLRHRLRILDLLHKDIIDEFASGNKNCVKRITIEVNREIRKLSGKSNKEIKQEVGKQLSEFKSVEKKLKDALKEKDVNISAGLIRKARIADELKWTCPYTGHHFCPFDLYHGKVDKDHIIPRSQRPSDSLESLVITFPEVNRMKGKRTAMQFIKEFEARKVEGMPNLTIRNAKDYFDFINKLDAKKGHDADIRRKKRRKELLQLYDYVETEFLPRDLTQTSQLVRLAALTIQNAYTSKTTRNQHIPIVTSMPGSVTGFVRKNWNLIGCLSTANPDVLDENRKPKNKTEIRNITHLHHALDACVLGLASYYLPRDGNVWELLVKRNLTKDDQHRLKAATKGLCEIRSDGTFGLKDLPNSLKDQIRSRLAERRVFEHIPSEMSGMAAEETVWRVFDPNDNHPSAHKLKKWFEQLVENNKLKKIPVPEDNNVLIVCRKRKSEAGDESGETLHETAIWRWIYRDIWKSKLIGLTPENDDESTLKRLKAVKIINTNYGLALDPEPQIIRFHKVYPRLRELRKQNNGKWPRVLRKGMLVRLQNTFKSKHDGIWRIASVKGTLHIDFIAVDSVQVKSKGPNVWREVSLKSLGIDNIKILPKKLTGHPQA